MKGYGLGLILSVTGCAEPTAIPPLPAAPAIVGESLRSNSYSISAGDRTVYVTLAQVRGEDGEPINAFVRRMFESADAADARRLVLDLRSVAGSDAFLLVPLIRGVIARDHFREHGGLVVVVGRDSFSPAQSTATLLRHYASPVFAY
jgi:hypothetical protein